MHVFAHLRSTDLGKHLHTYHIMQFLALPLQIVQVTEKHNHIEIAEM